MHLSDILRWLLAVVIGMFGWVMVSVNIRILFAWFVRKERGSMIFPVGGFFALLGMALCPLTQIRRFAWIPVAVDMGVFYSAMVIGLLMHLFVRRATKKKENA